MKCSNQLSEKRSKSLHKGPYSLHETIAWIKLALFCDKILQKLRKNFSCLHVFNIFQACVLPPPPPPNGNLSKNTGQYTKGGMYKRLGPPLLLCLEPPHTNPPVPQYKCAKRVKVYHRLLFLCQSISVLLMLVSSDEQNICLVQMSFVAGSL